METETETDTETGLPLAWCDTCWDDTPQLLDPDAHYCDRCGTCVRPLGWDD